MTSADEQITVKGSSLPSKQLHFGFTQRSFVMLHWQNTKLRKARVKNRVSMTDWKNRKDWIRAWWSSKAHVWLGFITFKTPFQPGCLFARVMLILPTTPPKRVCHQTRSAAWATSTATPKSGCMSAGSWVSMCVASVALPVFCGSKVEPAHFELV